MQINLNALSVRLVSKNEEARYRELMQQHHYLGDPGKIGHTLSGMPSPMKTNGRHY